jgi:protein-tyrosine phosphatase
MVDSDLKGGRSIGSRKSGGLGMGNNFKWLWLSIFIISFGFSCANYKAGENWTPVDNNLHQIEGPAPGKDASRAFRLYRSGAPSKKTFAKWCSKYKIDEVIDMAGTAKDHELAYQKQGVCPNIQVIYSETQYVNQPVTEEFLQFFDQEIEKAKINQAGVLFRCASGSHRTGRLAAYYQMKYQNLSPDQAINEMNKNGEHMAVHEATLVAQVNALNDYIHGRPCSQRKKLCVKKASE